MHQSANTLNLTDPQASKKGWKAHQASLDQGPSEKQECKQEHQEAKLTTVSYIKTIEKVNLKE